MDKKVRSSKSKRNAGEPEHTTPKPTERQRDVSENRGDDAATYEALAKATKKSSLIDRFNTAFHEVLQNRRGDNRRPSARAREMGANGQVSANDLAIRRAQPVKPRKMTVPEGVIIDGSFSSPAETEIEGRVEGDVMVEGFLSLGANALVSGKVHGTQCSVEGLVEGKVECSGDFELGARGRLKGDVLAGKNVTAAGQIEGNVFSGGRLHIRSTAQITGDIYAKQIVIEDGARVNGRCSMSSPPKQGGATQAKLPEART